MPRTARKRSESGIYHIIIRGVNKQNIFEDDRDKQKLYEIMLRYKEDFGFEVYSYCFMDNHLHLLAKEDEVTFSEVIKRISSSYVIWFNQKYQRCGHLFQDRYKSEPVENERYLLTVLRYIHQNPIKAGLARNVKNFRWSSYQEYLHKPELVDTNAILDMFAKDRREALNAFITYMNEDNDDQCLEFDGRTRRTDLEIKTLLSELGISTISELQQLEISKRNQVLKKLKSMHGVTIRQLSRITGISKSVIDRI